MAGVLQLIHPEVQIQQGSSISKCIEKYLTIRRPEVMICGIESCVLTDIFNVALGPWGFPIIRGVDTVFNTSFGPNVSDVSFSLAFGKLTIHDKRTRCGRKITSRNGMEWDRGETRRIGTKNLLGEKGRAKGSVSRWCAPTCYLDAWDRWRRSYPGA
jgi:hypothetical protein